MRLLSTLTLIAGLSVAAASLSAQDSSSAPPRNVPDSLVAKAKVSEDSARAVAVKRVPGDVKSTILERRSRRLVYEFYIQRAGRTGTTKVTVSAMNGKVTSVARVRTKRRSTARHSS
jgi:uncharacterized membrane protein YkoI